MPARMRLLFFVGGPYPAIVHEIEIVRDSGVLCMIREGEKILADGGFHGESALLFPFRKTKGKAKEQLETGA